MILRASTLVALMLASCAAHDPVVTNGTTAQPVQEIRYVSSDLRFAMVFSEGSARAGHILAFSPGAVLPSSTREIQTDDRVRCLSMGPQGSSVEFAIRRPIRTGDRYQCLRSSFRVTRCFADCRAAIVEADLPLSGGVRGTRKAYMYVDSCLGLLAWGDTGNFNEGIPLDAVWLRGNVGILADPSYPECDLYP